MSKKNIIDIGTKIDLTRFIRSKLLIQAGSDGGKSYAARKIVEEAYGKVQIIIIDPEEEYTSLREQYDFVMIGEGGEIPINSRYAETLAHKLLETGMNAIINLYEMDDDDRIEFVKNFVNAMTHAPKNLWHACIVVFDEFQIFAPDDGKAASTRAMRNASSRWRKRGYTMIAMTQRISMVDKTLVGQCHNRMIGLNTLDIDVERAGKELGFKRERWDELKQLQSGEFFAYGPAISKTVKKFKVSRVKTKHPKAGEIIKIPKTPDAIKKILSTLEDIPKEAEAELKTKQELEKKVRDQSIEIKNLKTGAVSPEKLAEIKKSAVETANKTIDQKVKIAAQDVEKTYKAGIAERDKEIKRLVGILQAVTKATGSDFQPAILAPVKVDTPKIEKIEDFKVEINVNKRLNAPLIQSPVVAEKEEKDTDEAGLNGPAKKILNAIAWFESVGIESPEQTAVAFLSGYAVNGGAYKNPRGRLNKMGYVEYSGSCIKLTDLGRGFTEYPATALDTEQLHEKIMSVLPGPEGKLMKKILEAYPMDISYQELADAVGYDMNGGAFKNPRGRLNAMGLVDYLPNQRIKAKAFLFIE